MEIAEHLWRIVGVRNTTMIVPVRNTSIPTPLKHQEICFHQHPVSLGIWFGENPLDFELAVMMLQISLLFLLSAALQWLLRPLRQSRFVCNVLAGIILGPSVLGRHKRFSALVFQPKGNYMIYVLWLIGGIYFVFLTTVKIESSMILKTARTSWNIALISFAFPFLTVFALLHLLKLEFHVPFFKFYAAASLSYTYFIVVARALHELNLITSELGQLALSLAIVYDALNILVVIGLSVVSQDTFLHSLGLVSSLIAFIVFTVFVIRPAILMIIRNTPKGKPVKEIYIISIYAVVAVMSVVLNLIGLPIVYGGVLIGLAVPDGPPLGSTLVDKAETLITEVFLPFVFVNVGRQTNVYSIKDWKLFLAFQIVIFAGYGSKFLGTLLAALRYNVLLKNAVLLSLIMNIKGIIELFVYSRWLSTQFVDDQIFSQLVLSMLGVTMVITPIIDKYYKPQWRLDQHHSIGQKGIRSIQRCWNDSEFRVVSCIHCQDNVRSIISLLQGSNPTEASRLSAYVIHLIELVGRAAPLLVRHDKQSKRSKAGNSVNSDYIMKAFDNFSKKSSGPVEISPFVLIAPYKSMHDCISRFALDNLIPFVIVPFHENQRLAVDYQAMASMRHFNTSLQASAPCTVGILVDRSFNCHVKPAIFSYRVAVIFVGGVDDREALALAARMSGHSTVNITVIHIFYGDGKQHPDEDRKQDEFLINEFKLKNRSNPRVQVREIQGDSRETVIESLRSIENGYDLMMVGRRRANALAVDEEMSEFVENAELGLIGDMLASSDICGGEASVLVVQHAFPVDGDHQVTSSEDSEKSLMASGAQKFNGG